MSGIENAALIALVAIVPLVVLTLTSFVKVSVVLSLVRNAIGAPDAPSGLVVTGLSLVLTFFVMAPVAVNMVQAAATPPAPMTPLPKPIAPQPGTPSGTSPGQPAPQPGTQPAPRPGTQPAPQPGTQPGSRLGQPALQPGTPPGQLAPHPGPSPAPGGASAPAAAPPVSVEMAVRALVPAQYQPQLAAVERGLQPLHAFLEKHTRQADRETFQHLSTTIGNGARGDELWVLAPAFITTELREAFAIAILIFVPFLVIDLVVTLGLASLGLQTTSPQTIALPLKLALFVAVDGWRLLLDSLLRGYA